MADLDRDRLLALSYIALPRRLAVDALWRLDVALGAVLAGGRDPMLSRIKLAWWREALERLDREPAPAEPMLQSASAYLLPRGLSGAELSGMEGGWGALLAPEALETEDLDLYAAERGARLFRYTAHLLGDPGFEPAGPAGEAWALVDLARHSGNQPDADAALAAARARSFDVRWPSRLRPLGMLAALARRDAEESRLRWEEPGAPGRMVRMMRHRLTGC
jgi:15-cis-phytoene synthase